MMRYKKENRIFRAVNCCIAFESCLILLTKLLVSQSCIVYSSYRGHRFCKQVAMDFLVDAASQAQAELPLGLEDDQCSQGTIDLVPAGAAEGDIQELNEVGGDTQDQVDEHPNRQLNPWHRDYSPEMCGLRTPSMKDRVYTFLFNSSLLELREMGRATRTKHTGVKNAVICYLLLKARSAVSTGKVDWNEFFCNRFHEFWSNPLKISTPMRLAPPFKDILDFSSDGVERSKKRTAITTHEFARLFCLLVENEQARRELLQSGLDLTRIEQQRRMDRDVFWESIVAVLHNDPTKTVGTKFIGCVDADDNHTSINPNLPVPQKQSGSWLKEKFFSVRAAFIRAFHNWTRSGQNSSDGFAFHKFVPRAPSSTAISSIGRYCLIMFYAMKCGTEEEDTEVLNFTSKIVPFGAGYDDGDALSHDSPSGGSSRKRKKVMDDFIRESKIRNKNISELVSSVKEMASASNPQGSGTSSLDEIFKLTTQLNTLQSLGNNNELTKQSIRITAAALKKAQDKCFHFLQD